MQGKPRHDARADPHAAPPRKRRLLRGLLWSTALLSVAAAGAAGLYVRSVWDDAPGVPQLTELQPLRPSVLVSADGQVLTSFVRAQQEPVPLSRISPHVKQALIDTEDRRFYAHRGVDPLRTAMAAWRTANGDTQGGSTLTQQLARNLFPEEIGRARTVARKVKEWITALRIERAYGKDQILEHYLNTAPFLYNAIGIEMAARTYYGKPATDLDVLESATLVGMLKGTRYYNPVINPERALVRRNVVLRQMQRSGHLAAADYERLRAQPLKVSLNRPPESLGPAPHFAVQARRWLTTWADRHRVDLYADGLRIETTLDTRLQEAALRAVERQARALQAVADVEWSAASPRVRSASPEAYERARAKVEPFAYFWSRERQLVSAFVREHAQFKDAVRRFGSESEALHGLLADPAFMAQLKREKTRLEAGFIAIAPDTGEVKAWVGSRDFEVDQYDHVAQAARQPWSTFKPFVYGAALEAGLLPDRSYVDGPLEVRLADGSVWRPTDMSGATNQPMSMHDGLVQSKNTVTAQVALDVGVSRIVALAKAMGIEESPLDPVPSLALGTSPVTLLEMAAGYATIARQGEYHRPVTIRRILDQQGRVMAEFGGETRRALSPEAAADLIDMMRGVVNRGTGTLVKSRFGVTGDIAGKTGTSQNNSDGWFILMHPRLVAGAWVGFNDQRVAMRSNHWGQGGHNAILLVGDFFRAVQKDKLVATKDRFPPPRHPAPPPPPGPGPESDPASYALQLEADPPGALAAPVQVIVRREDGSVVVGDKASVTTSRRAAGPPKSAEELDRALEDVVGPQRRGGEASPDDEVLPPR